MEWCVHVVIIPDRIPDNYFYALLQRYTAEADYF